MNIDLTKEELSQLYYELTAGIENRRKRISHTQTTGDVKRILRETITRCQALRLKLVNVITELNNEEKKL